MANDLERFRDHARRMATAQHQEYCRAERNVRKQYWETLRSCSNREPHHGHKASQWAYCPGVCGGCVTDRDRALWTQIADEIDAYLNPDQDQEEPLPW